MGYSFTQWKNFHKSRAHHKAKDYRHWGRYVRVRATDDKITFHYMNAWAKHKNEPGMEQLLATLTVDNVLTFHLNFNERKYKWDTKTICNRIQVLTGLGCYSDKMNHRNKESCIRFYARKEHLSIPYAPGTSFKLDEHGGIVKILHREPDRRIQVKPDMAQKTKADTAVLRKLVIAMARMGTFNDHMTVKMDNAWRYKPTGNLADVNYTDPTGVDAEIVFSHGLNTATSPDRHRWDGNKYIELHHDQRLALLRDRAVENGMKLLRHRIYRDHNGYEKVEV